MRFSFSSFIIGAIAAGTVAALPAAAAVTGLSPLATNTPGEYDGTAPSLTVSPFRFITGTVIRATSSLPGCENYPDNAHHGVDLEMTWKATDAASGIASYDIYDNYGLGRDVTPDTQQTSLRIGHSDMIGPCGGGELSDTYQIVAKDKEGNTATSAASAPNLIDVWQEDGTNVWWTPSLTVKKTGAWKLSPCLCSDGGKTLFSTVAGSSVTYFLPAVHAGADIAIVMGKNSNRAPVGLSIDNGTVTQVDTYSATPQNRVVVWRASLTPGAHTLKVTNQTLSGSARNRVDIDAVMLTRGRAFYQP